MLRFSLALLLLAPLSCRNKDDSAQDTADIGTLDSVADTGGIDADDDGYTAGQDCDDDDAGVNPGQDEEPYDGIDNDCDETTPDDDVDGDGFGFDDDCDDSDAAVNPDATEICNDLDDDCNDQVDDATGDSWYADDDQDGYGDPEVSTQSCDGATGYVADATDCDDANDAINPGTDEVCDGLDNDCDLLTDDDDPSLVDARTWFGDLDGDGWGDPANAVDLCEGPSLFVLVADDCDDTDTEINPDATEVCNEVDDDCDGFVDADDDSVEGLQVYYIDDDGDGYGVEDSSTLACDVPSGFADNPDDCNDDEPLAWPGANETCNDLDDDCDGDIDEADSSDAGLWYLDDDSDGYGDASVSVASCDEATGYVADATDCDDSDSAVNPGALEVCNGTDDDCDSLADDDDPDVDDPGTWYDDSDGDGFGDAAGITIACDTPNDTVSDDTDCDDADADVNPGATELCNGGDDDCDTLVDDDDPDVADRTTWYLDFDGDGFGNGDFTVDACEAPSGYVANDLDCEDAYAEANPAGAEVCDNLDNDCNGDVDDGASDAPSWYTDGDGDGYGDASSVTVDCDAPTNAVSDATDCDDSDSAVNPGEDEVCNGVDDDCDSAVDDDDSSLDSSTATTWYADGDGDGHGDAATSWTTCDAPSGTVIDDTDCDDGDAAVNPSATEVCNAIDDDCDGDTDDDDASLDDTTATTWYDDDDGDGYGDPGDDALRCDAPSDTVADDSDCDDGDDGINPAATEVCNGVDDDCDGSTDDDDSSLDDTTTSTWYDDADGDGYGDADTATTTCDSPSSAVADATDCDDAESAVNPGATEVCNDVDDDCDGAVDDDDSDLDSGTASSWYSDSDGDGFGDPDSVAVSCDGDSAAVADDSDCDDGDADVNPDATEVCGGDDEDCDGLADDDDPDVSDPDTWYLDYDGDSFGDTAFTQTACEPSAGYVATSTDCDDLDGAVNPDATEVCDGTDNDCDGKTDEDDSSLDTTTATTWHADSDGDGFGDDSGGTLACGAPSGSVADGTDCDDGDSAVNPDAAEICNDTDDDCDGDTDDDDSGLDTSTATPWYGDSDGDGFGDASSTGLTCDVPTGTVGDGTDCDDGNAAVNPAATEVCNSVDDDCNGQIDDDDSGLDTSTATSWYDDGDGDGYGDADSSSVSCTAPSATVTDDTDCDDADAAVNPAATEVCNSVDDDCDSDVDDDDNSLDTTTASTWYADSDGDGYGDPGSTALTCVAPSAHGTDATDCDDGDGLVNPGATEICNGDVDDDCSGAADDADSGLDTSTATTWYVDGDGDGYGTSSSTTVACDQPSNGTTDTTDCDDGDSGINPGATEVCVNVTDENCDGQYSEGCATQYVSCGGPEAMDPGQSESCSIGATVIVEGVYISVGCNDGETGSYTISFEDGGSESVGASCGSSSTFSDHQSNTVGLTMSSGGGGDNHISFMCCGSGGWGIYYR